MKQPNNRKSMRCPPVRLTTVMWSVEIILGLLLVMTVAFADTSNSTTSTGSSASGNGMAVEGMGCRYLLLAPFSTEKGDKTLANYTELGAHYAASAQLAIDYLNQEYQGCTISSTTDSSGAAHSGTSTSTALKLVEFGDLLIRDTQQEDTIGFQELVGAVESYGYRNDNGNDNSQICGVVGPFDGKGQEKAITYTEVHGLPTMSLTGMDIDDLAGKDGKTSIGNMMDIKEYCDHLAFYLKHHMELTHLVLISNNSKKGRKMQDDIIDAMNKQGIEIRVLRFEEEQHKDWEKTRLDLQQVKDTGIRNVLILADERVPLGLSWIAQHLQTLDMLQGDYQYFLFEDNIRPREIDFLFGEDLQEQESPLAKLLHGAGWFNTIDPFDLTIHTNSNQLQTSDPFLQRFQTFNATRIEYPKTAIPLEQDHFHTAIPFRLSSYVYDSILAMGIGKCNAMKEEMQKGNKPKEDDKDRSRRVLQDNNNSPPPRPEDGDGNGPPPRPEDGEGSGNKPPPRPEDAENGGGGGGGGGGGEPKPPKKDDPKPPPPKNDVIRNIVQLPPFLGASGVVSFDYNKDERFRTVETMQMAMFNFRVVVKDNQVVTVETPIVAHLNTSTQQWITLEPFIFGSASSNTLPNRQFVVSDENYLSNWVFGIGLFLFIFGAIFAVASFAAVTYYQQDGVVRMAQPFFLKLICLGSFIEVCAILPLSLDESRGLGDGQLDAACMSVPWLFFIGHSIIYSAIFCKLWRVDQVMSAQRRTRTEFQVLWPLGVILFVIVTILIVWTAVSPWMWERDFVSLSPPETYGKCYSDDFGAFFASLAAVLMGCTLITGFFVWKTKDISQDLSDTSTIFYLIVTQLQAWFVGIPILAVIGDSSVDSVYFGRILLIWVFAMAPLLIVLLPRISNANYVRRHPELLRKKRGNVHVSGLDPTSRAGKRGSVASSTNSSAPLRASLLVSPAIMVQPQEEGRVSVTSSTGFNVSDCHESTGEFGSDSRDDDLKRNRNDNTGGLPLEHISEHPTLEEAALFASERRIQTEAAAMASNDDKAKEKEGALGSVDELPEMVASDDDEAKEKEHDEQKTDLNGDSDEFHSG
ncbi:Gamma-aminobutyric acid (GABA) B receptor [Seminavis robusta]|uniref:Gamma-aminobutyric acid (GABA) B receptor n=1 Tax=Seminavis robusta TaxID=568900 RepID=A0A9N8H0K2_9STRA|nr:Gamma-aminobutyric acid (GABA) B receptor [Seminavis robusta]|eukprot:Sro3_g002460.1 Gamma-aminobutyric acid (GABA) B receptor (1087) ;mRNA; f:166322-169792